MWGSRVACSGPAAACGLQTGFPGVVGGGDGGRGGEASESPPPTLWGNNSVLPTPQGQC